MHLNTFLQVLKEHLLSNEVSAVGDECSQVNFDSKKGILLAFHLLLPAGFGIYMVRTSEHQANCQ